MVAATPAGMEHETFLTFKETMQKLKCSRGTLTNCFRRSGGLEGFRLNGGRMIYTTVEAIGRFMVPVENDGNLLYEVASRSPRSDAEGDAAMAEYRAARQRK